MLELTPSSSGAAWMPPPPAPAVLTRADKQAAIDRELQADAGRSDREIAKLVGYDHKTVSARRKETSPAEAQISPPGTPQPDDGLVDVVLPKGTLRLDPETAKVVQQVEDQIAGATLRVRRELNQAADTTGKENDEVTLLLPRREVTIQHDKERGHWILKQRNWPDEDSEIWIDEFDIHAFVDELTDLFVPSVGRSS